MRGIPPLLKFAAVTLSLAPLALFAYLGQYARFISDDYMIMFVGNNLGPIDGMIYWYNNWNGMYVHRFIVSMIAPLDIVAVSAMPLLSLSVWLAGIVWLVHQGVATLRVRKHVTSISLGVSALSLAAIADAYYSSQNLYWYASSSAYVLGLGLFTCYFALAIHVARRPLRGRAFRIAVTAGGLLCFASAGMAEMHAVAQAIIISSLLCYIGFQYRSALRRRLLFIFGAGWLLTTCGLVIQATSPGVAIRATEVMKAYGAPARDPLILLQETSTEFIRWIQNPDAFAGFTMLVALGCLIMSHIYPAQQESKTVRPTRITAIEVLIPLALQMMFLPLVWSHISDAAMFFGRFSPSYMLVVLGNLALIACLSFVLWRIRSFDAFLRSHNSETLAAMSVLLFVLICASVLILTHVVDIVGLAQIYLVSSAMVVLAILGRRLLAAARPLLIWQLGVLAPLILLLACACLAGLIFVAIYGQGYVISRILEPVASLIVFSGLIWGAFLGCVFRLSARSSILGAVMLPPLRFTCVGIVSAVGLGMMLGHAALIPDFQTYAREWDARHQSIIEMRDAGQTVIEVAPLSYSLDRFVGKDPLGKGPVTAFAETYYGVDEIIVKDG